MSERPTTCRHFTGIQNETCKVGVNYRKVADPDKRPLALPCFSDQGCTARCSQVSYYTEQELAEQDREANEAIKAYLDKLNNGVCPLAGKSKSGAASMPVPVGIGSIRAKHRKSRKSCIPIFKSK